MFLNTLFFQIMMPTATDAINETKSNIDSKTAIKCKYHFLLYDFCLPFSSPCSLTGSLRFCKGSPKTNGSATSSLIMISLPHFFAKLRARSDLRSAFSAKHTKSPYYFLSLLIISNHFTQKINSLI